MLSLPPYPLEETFDRFFAEAPALDAEQRTGWTRDDYRRLAEPLVRVAAPWRQADGSIVDGFARERQATADPRYVAAVALAVGAGVCSDLLDSAARCMDRALEDLHAFANGRHELLGPDFYPKELAMGFRFLGPRVKPGRLEHWRELFGYDAETAYFTSLGRAGANFWIYAGVGDFLRYTLGVIDSPAFTEQAVKCQLPQFTEYGMYRDPNDPATYDLTVRQNLALLMDEGYDGHHRHLLDELLRRGALTTLLFQSTTGQMPFGGRSNQFHMMEAMAVCFAERQARWCKQQGDMRRAGAFKRLARTAAQSIEPWIAGQAVPFHTKNRFDPRTRHGTAGHQGHSTYGLLAANLLLLAWHSADETIEEDTTPADVGGHVLALEPAFHRVWATCVDYHVQIDLAGQPEHDATGLGRLHRRGVRPETALSAPMAAKPVYHTTVDLPGQAFAIGPSWPSPEGGWRHLAEFDHGHVASEVAVVEQTPERVCWTVRYCGDLDGVEQVCESYALSTDGLTVTWSLTPRPQAMRVLVPAIETDGAAQAERHAEPDGLRVTYEGHTFHVRLEGEFTAEPNPARTANRNAVYAVHAFTFPGGKATAHLAIE